MAHASGFAFDLSGLGQKDSLQRALEEKMERGKEGPFKTIALGGGIDNEPDVPIPGEEQVVTLSAAWLLALRGACIKPTNPYYGYINSFTKVLYAFQFMICFAAAIASIIFNKWIQFDLLDWFGWSVFAVFLLAEFLLVYIRLLGRWSEVGKPGRYDSTGFQECVEAIASKRKFGAQWQATSVVVVQLVGSALMVWGMLVMMMQMMLDEHDDARATWRWEDRREWTHMWTAIFSVVVAFQIAAAIMDPTRIGELDTKNFSVELTATRVVLMIIVAPLVAPAFCVYANVCCDGDWIL